MKKYIISSLIIALACSILGCQSLDKQQAKQQDKPVVVNNINVDNYYVKGPNKQVFDKAPQRVLVIGENETETLLELGAAPNILMAVAQNSRQYAMRPENWEQFQKIKKMSQRLSEYGICYKHAS